MSPTSDGPLVIRFSAEGSVRDLNSGGGFSGHNYAAMFVRVLVNGASGGAGGAVLRQHRQGRRVEAAADDDVLRMGEARHWRRAPRTFKLQFKNLHAFDDANLDSFTLTAHFH